ncbi:hypothetical protein HDU93_000466 [Gonapodya sp. JEL0774]|nr:hypothetical protein HDU93_000466 [Gonapodya sp. JEL0774]
MKRKNLKDQLKIVLAQKDQIIKARRREEALEKLQKAQHPKKPSGPGRPIIPYGVDETILLVGEGNFSFALALISILESKGAQDFSRVYATSLDSSHVMSEKYPDGANNVALLKQRGVNVLHEVDGTALQKVKLLKKRQFEKISFVFPHAGAGITDQERNILSNQLLLRGFFVSSSALLSPTRGQVHVVLKEKEPYLSWNIKKIAKEAGLRCLRSWEWSFQWYPGYVHRRTLGFKEGLSVPNNEELKGKCREYCFVLPSYVEITPEERALDDEGDVSPDEDRGRPRKRVKASR